jgi:hypothetical protein
MSVRQTFLFDEGPNGASPAVSGDLIESSGMTYTTSGKHGAFGLIGSALGSQFIGINNSGTVNHSGSLYVKPTTQVDGSNRVLNINTSTNTVIFAIRINSNGHFQLVRGSTAVNDTVFSWVANQWYRIDWQYDQTTLAAPIMTVRFFTNPDGTVPDETYSSTQSAVPSNMSKWRMGLISNSTVSATTTIDTFRVADGLEWIGPYVSRNGKGKVWDSASSTWVPFTPKPYVSGAPVTAKAKVWDAASGTWKTTNS